MEKRIEYDAEHPEPKEIIKHEDGLSAFQTLQLLLTIDHNEAVSIAKTAVKDGPRGLVARGMSVIQRWNEVRFGEAFLAELEEMRRAGEIREDFNRTDAGVSSLREFFEMIDGKPDEDRFQAFCALFMSANAPGSDSNEAIFDLELMGILRALSAGEMHLLSAFLRIGIHKVGGDSVMFKLAKELGYSSEALVHKNIQALIKHGLISQSTWGNLGGTVGEPKQLLTDLGLALQKHVEKYKEFKERQQGK